MGPFLKKRMVVFFLVALLCSLTAEGKETSPKHPDVEKGNLLIERGINHEKQNQFQKALSDFQEALQLFKGIDYEKGELRALHSIGLVYERVGRYKESLGHYEQSVEISRRIGFLSGEATTLANMGVICVQLGRFKEALDYTQRAFDINVKLDDVNGAASAIHIMGNAYNSLGEYTMAMGIYQKAIELVRSTGNVKREGRCLNDIGLTLEALGFYQEALSHYQTSLEIAVRTGDLRGELGTLNNIGIVYLKLGKYEEALSNYRRAGEISREVGFLAGEAKSLMNVGSVLEKIGQYADALDHYEKSIVIFRKIENPVEESRVATNIGVVYNHIGKYDKALEQFAKSIEILKKTDDALSVAYIDTNIGTARLYSQDYEQALRSYKSALKTFQATGNVFEEANVLLNIGVIYSSLGQFSEALTHLQKALEANRQVNNMHGEMITLLNIGIIYKDQGRYEDAVNTLYEAIAISTWYDIPEVGWRAQSAMGMVFRKSGDGREAVKYYEFALDDIEKLYRFTKGLNREERFAMMGDKRFVFKEFIDLLLELHKKYPEKGYDKKAFAVSEKSKSKAFQELMARAGAKTVLAGDDNFLKMIEKEKSLLEEVNALRQRLKSELAKPNGESNPDVIRSMEALLPKKKDSFKTLEKEIDEKYPRYADLKRPKPLSVQELQGILKPDETVISYGVGEQKTALFIIGKEIFRIKELDAGSQELKELVMAFRRGLEDSLEFEDLGKFKPENAYRLYQKIFEPIAGELENRKKLYISADDVLYTLPFEALVDKEIDPKAFRKAKKKGKRGETAFLGEYQTVHYLIESFAITYLPSASVLRSLRQYQKPGYGKWQIPIIAFADPVFSPEELEGGTQRGISKETKLSIDLLNRATGGGALLRLKETAQEAEAIALTLKGNKEDIYLRKDAAEINVHASKIKKAQYILFSTHGLLGGDFENVAEPSLALTLVGNPPGSDGFLSMSEVLGLDLHADMVILSACNTSGRGDKAGSGEGFAGLTRSFMYSGSRSLLVTHWSVESASARDLMVETFNNITKYKKPEALRQAKLRMMRSSRDMGDMKLSLSHPYFWAPFVLVGEGE